jgi:hypothetical protein
MSEHWTASGVFAEVGMREAMEELVALQDTGASKAECDAFLRSKFPGAENDRGRWFKCSMCEDEGLVRVWSQRAMQAYLKGELDDRKNRTTARMACECDRGRRMVGVEEMGKPKPFFTRHYDPKLDCLCHDPESIEDIAELEKWCDAKLTEKPANYTTAFDDHNSGKDF